MRVRAEVRPKKLPDEAEMSLFYRSLAALLSAGIPIDRAFDFLRTAQPPRVAAVAEFLRDGLTQGHDLLSLLTSPRLGGAFPPVAVGMIHAGMRTGGLVEALSRVARLSERTLRLKKAVGAALIYPCVLLVAVLCVAALFLLVLAPGDRGLFALFGGTLPWPTRLLVGLSELLRSPWGAAGVVLLVGGAMLATRRVGPRRLWDRVSLRLPLVGPLLRKTLAARMLFVIASCTQVGISVTEALVLTQEVTGNRQVRMRLDRALKSFHSGCELPDALEFEQLFPRLVTAVIRVGLETGDLDRLLERLARVYEEDVERAILDTARLMEPLLLGAAGLLAGLVALATLMPVIELVDRF